MYIMHYIYIYILIYIQIDEKYNNNTVDKGQYYEADPTGLRTGNGVGSQLTETIERVCADTETMLDAVS